MDDRFSIVLSQLHAFLLFVLPVPVCRRPENGLSNLPLFRSHASSDLSFFRGVVLSLRHSHLCATCAIGFASFSRGLRSHVFTLYVLPIFGSRCCAHAYSPYLLWGAFYDVFPNSTNPSFVIPLRALRWNSVMIRLLRGYNVGGKPQRGTMTNMISHYLHVICSSAITII